jgi:hypothetical protein
MVGGREAYLRLLASHGLDEKSILPVLRPELMQPDGDKLARLNPLELLQVITFLVEASGQNTNDVLATLADELRTGFRQADVTPPDGVYHGVFPTGLFNARVAPDGGGGLLVLVESGAFELIEYVATLVTGPWSKDETVDRIGRACSTYHASVDNVSPWLPDAQRELDLVRKPSWEQYRMAVGLTNAAEFFLLAHEWAHVILGHMAGPAPRTVATPAGDLDVYVRSRVQNTRPICSRCVRSFAPRPARRSGWRPRARTSSSGSRCCWSPWTSRTGGSLTHIRPRPTGFT